MFIKTEVLFCAVALATLLTVQARIWSPSNTMEREGTCDKLLRDACAGVADAIPFAYPPEPKKIDEACSVASAHFPCIKNFANSCDPEDIESRYFMTYVDVCDSSSPLYEGIRKSIRCMKIAEKNFNKTCLEPMEKLGSELVAFSNKISDHGISSDDWRKLESGFLSRYEVVCFLQKTDECDGKDGVSTDIVKELFMRLGSGRKIAFLLENQALVNKVLDNLNLEDDLKKLLRGENH